MTHDRETCFERGLAAYGEGRHFEAHEHWEELWRSETDPVMKLALQGLIQIAASMHKLLQMGDAQASLRLLDRAQGKLEGVPEGSFGLRIGDLRADIDRARVALAASSVSSVIVDINRSA